MDLLLFSHDRDYAAAALAGGVAGVVVDWEWRGKTERQSGHDTQINRGTPEDLVAMRAIAGERVVCRINNSEHRDAECLSAISHGASEIWLPMVRSVAEVEQCLRCIDGQARLGLMVETREAMRLGREFATLPLSRLYVGLHDYRIDTGNANMFAPIVDGTLDRFREDYPGAIGVAGITRPERGHPIPQRLLLAAMVRLRCDFGIARRAFRADVAPERIDEAVADIGAEVAALHARLPMLVEDDHRVLRNVILAMEPAQPRAARHAEPGFVEHDLACVP
ncbi:hypothetical protein LVB87_15285 [Lysobacter sp. KIS68-7]|uniref:hypothetical protein n=1 Tax=Lysobacter sp. KIS68-7 TaxID=2904252 RepID=UPI001E2F7CC7|nr:hypothetical protein [Lysobacter sp. KIS68-7]UHQ19530.1 hypothetical protein LVB87_15285 [Lysobacter sp. KIS68-7]